MLLYRVLDAVDDVADVGVGDVGAGGEAQADLEDGLGDGGFRGVGGAGKGGAEGGQAARPQIRRGAGIDRLPVHRLPERPGFHASSVHPYAEGLDVGVGLTVSRGRGGHVDDAGRAADCALHGSLVSVLLSFHMQRRIKDDGAEPVVRVELPCRGLAMHADSRNVC